MSSIGTGVGRLLNSHNSFSMTSQHPSFHQKARFFKSSMHTRRLTTVGTYLYLSSLHRTAVALKGKDGVVFAVENIVLSKLYEAGCTKRIYNIDTHIGMALVERVSMHMHAYTLYSAIRPFGVSLLLGSYEKDGAHLYVIEPSGISYAYEGCAIGKAKQNAKTELEQLKLKDMTIQELIKEAAKIIYTVHDEIKDKSFELNLSWIGAPEEYAKKALEEADDLDEEME
ncbi:unnamed protein product [Schistocephalus solidus]|uniref:Proteasome subunit alpha type-3 n=1 Tax=Schistocephalus solidus TaxID=70667 RepID=A0A183SKI3_SCHSO|nr:unnamed protein product [Schistocephalus solidus]